MTHPTIKRQPSRHAAPATEVRLGIIGAGWAFTEFHLPTWGHVRGAKIVAVCDLDLARAQRVAKQFDAQAFDDAATLLERDDLDAIYLLVPPFAHGALEDLIIERNLPFFIEKPVSLNLEQARHTAAKIERRGLVTSVGYHRRYARSTDEILKCTPSADVRLISSTWLTVVPPIDWWGQTSRSGGQIVEQGSHILDLFRYLCGDVHAVQAAQNHHTPPTADFDVADVSTVLLEFTNGAVGSVSFTCSMPPGHHRVTLQVVGNDCTVELFESQVKIHEPNQTRSLEWTLGPEDHTFVRESNAFLDAVRTGDPSPIRSTYADGVETLTTVLAARLSAEERRRVVVSDMH